MKKTIVISLMTVSITAGIIYVIQRFHKKNVEVVKLDFAEYALGGC